MALALSLFSRQARALGRNYEVRQIGAHTFVWVPDDVMDQSGDPYFSRAGNVGFVITSGGVVVINSANNPTHAREVLYEIRQRTDVPVTLVVDLGPEGDQMLGNEVFAEQGATIVSTSGAAAKMRSYPAALARRSLYDPELPVRMRGIHITFPDQTFTGATRANVGGTEIEAISLNCGPAGSTAEDAAVYLPHEKILFLGDLYVRGFVPQVEGRNLKRWISVLGQVGRWGAGTFVPGHGDPGARSAVAGFRGFLEWLDGGVEAGVEQGKSLEQVQEQLLASSAFNLLALDLAPGAIADVYHQVVQARSAHLSPSGAAQPFAPHARETHPPSIQGTPGFVGGSLPVVH